MKILLITVGRKNNPGFEEEISDFTERLGHYAPVEWKLLPPSNKGDMDIEGKSILKSLDERDHVVLLDEKGKELSSVGLSEFIQKRLNASTHRLIFIIGGAYGVSKEVRASAHTTLALSQLTFPHQLVRLVLIEQIYRAFTILKGEKYNHA